jgi:hypothetical protein
VFRGPDIPAMLFVCVVCFMVVPLP